MKIKELRDKSDVELERMLAELRSKLQDQRFGLAGRRFKRVREVRDVRKGIARILTLMKERAAAQPQAPVKAEGKGE